jgi:hypothetical protein
MLKGWAIILLTGLLTAAGCASTPGQSDPTEGGGMEPSTVEQTRSIHHVKQAIVSRSQAFGRVNENVYGIFKEPDDVNAFEEAVRTAKKIDGQLDIRKPDYDIIFETNGSQPQRSVHLWVDPDSEIGMYTEVTDTGTGYSLSAGATQRLKALIGGLDYSLERAATNGDLVNLHGKLTNLDNWKRFLANVKNGTADDIHITSFTIEGDPIFEDLIFDGQTIEYTFDNTHDAFGKPVKTVSFCSKIEDNKAEKGIEYRLSGCGDEREGDNSTFRLLVQ